MGKPVVGILNAALHPDHTVAATEKVQPTRTHENCAHHEDDKWLCKANNYAEGVDPEKCDQWTPAPAPLPEEVEQAVARLKVSVQNVVMGGWKQAMPDLDTILRHLSDLTRRLAGVEEENVRLRPRAEIAGSLLTRTSKAEKRCRELEEELTLCLKEAPVGILAAICDMNKILGLEMPKTSYTEIPPAIQAVVARAESAEARVRELEAFKARVMALARGRCECCKNNNPENGACPDDCYPGRITAWTPPQAWEVKP